MDEIQLQSFIFPILASLVLLWSIRRWYDKPKGIKNLPPSPPTLPIIGNFHQVGSLAHRDLGILARKHGPMMLLHFGSVPVLVVSSADAAREITKTHDLTFASRPLHNVSSKMTYNGKDIVFAPYGDQWRRAKSIFVLRLLSSKRVQSYRSIRVEDTALLVKKIRECSSRVNLSELFSEFTNDGICKSAFGRKYSDSENGKKSIELFGEVSQVVGTVCVGVFIPWLSWIDRLRGFYKRADRVAREVDEFLEGVIQERFENDQEFVERKYGDSFVDILVEIYNDKTGDVSIDRDGIKGLLLDAFAGGTETTSTFLDWAMAELLRHPAVMLKLQNEVREIAQENGEITDNDLKRMHYLKAVIKEVLRLHPPLPLLIPRLARNDVEIKGYHISAGTWVMVNAWAIGRDPMSWDEPEKFKPERFLTSSIDFNGLSFEYLPFRAGRRVCPGITFANATIELVLANLMQKFNWKLPDGTEGEELEMCERPGVTVQRGVPLFVVASERK